MYELRNRTLSQRVGDDPSLRLESMLALAGALTEIRAESEAGEEDEVATPAA